MRERNVLVFDHVLQTHKQASHVNAEGKSEAYLNLAFHRDGEENNEIHDKDRPKHWHVKSIETRAYHCNQNGFQCAVPVRNK